MKPLSSAAAKVIGWLPRKKVGQVLGGLADLSWPGAVGSAVIGAYSRAYNVDFADCERTGGFESFDDFFTRTLRPGTRPLDPHPEAILSPCDGKLESAGRIEGASTFLVKGSSYSAEDLLGSAADAKVFEKGGACVIYLSPRDYHRVHVPVDGTVRTIRSMPGDYFPVNDLGVEHFPRLFARNRRVAMMIDSDQFGKVGLVMVAAMVVGRITVSGIEDRDVSFGLHQVSRKVVRGDELGIFHLGSTVVMFFEERAYSRFVPPLHSPVKLGEQLTLRDGAGTRKTGSA